jgi:hypothetical protein
MNTFPPATVQSQTASNIPEADTTAEDDAHDPNAALNAFSAHITAEILGEGVLLRCSVSGWRGGAGYHVWVGGEENGGSCGSYCSGQDETWL